MHPAIEGLQYVPNYLDAATHDALIASVDRHPWLQSADRGVQIYGYRYHHPTQSMCQIGDLPPWAAGLAARLCRDGFVSSTPNQVVVNDYRPGAGILAHVDQAAFGDTVASVSLGSSCVMKFSRTKTERSHEILLEPQSLLVLSGEARWEWCHGIPARTADTWQQQERPRGRRVSVTFREIPVERR